jgi:hypothetical protein
MMMHDYSTSSPKLIARENEKGQICRNVIYIERVKEKERELVMLLCIAQIIFGSFFIFKV